MAAGLAARSEEAVAVDRRGRRGAAWHGGLEAARAHGGTGRVVRWSQEAADDGNRRAKQGAGTTWKMTDGGTNVWAGGGTEEGLWHNEGEGRRGFREGGGTVNGSEPSQKDPLSRILALAEVGEEDEVDGRGFQKPAEDIPVDGKRHLLGSGERRRTVLSEGKDGVKVARGMASGSPGGGLVGAVEDGSRLTDTTKAPGMVSICCCCGCCRFHQRDFSLGEEAIDVVDGEVDHGRTQIRRECMGDRDGIMASRENNISAMGDLKIVVDGEEAGDGVRVQCILVGEHEGVRRRGWRVGTRGRGWYRSRRQGREEKGYSWVRWAYGVFTG